MQPNTQLPRVIMFYGPPGSGKNTQGELLLTVLPDYKLLDYGSELREYVTTYQHSNDDTGVLARRIADHINQGELVPTTDLMKVIGNKISKSINEDQPLILIGAGRDATETKMLAQHLATHKTTSAVIHLHISLNDSIKRLSHRFFVPHSNTPYSSYEDALQNCPIGVTPITREDDKDAKRITQRYCQQYKHKFSSILFTMQLHAQSHVFMIDADQSIQNVHHDILRILSRYYHTSFDNKKLTP